MGKSVARITKPPAPVPPLRDGDRMDAKEFWRRYEADPNVTRAELIKGVVYIISDAPSGGREPAVPPISNEGHAAPHFELMGWLAAYAAYTPGVRGSAPATVRDVSPNSTPEPDALLRILPECGGRSATDGRGYYVGLPELVAEVSHTTTGHDLGSKLDLFQEQGVPEYLVWRTRQRTLDWFRLNRAGRYAPLPSGDDGILRSRVFPGLWLDVEALLSGDMAKVLAVTQQGVASPEHAAFVEKLRKAAARKKR